MRHIHLHASFGLSVIASLTLACGGDDAPGGPPGGSGGDGNTPHAGSPGTFLEAEPQRPGDPRRGYDALLSEGYIACGVPWTAYALVSGTTPEEEKIPGRAGRNADLPYYLTSTTTASGVEIVTRNCLYCHASSINGEVVIGLGAAHSDHTEDVGRQARLISALVSDPVEQAEARRWASRMQAIAPYMQTASMGVNPADSVTSALFAHRDPVTLAWSDEPLIPLPEPNVLPVDVPPWWRMAKKNTLYYNGAGRGDHARLEMLASVLCTDTVDEVEEFDRYFPDIRAYIATIEPPAWPFPVDAALAGEGRGVFERSCARCHGTYGEDEAYPNLLIALDDVGTDSMLARSTFEFLSAEEYVAWFNRSYFGELSRLEPHDGYVAPPLDGIWATAPYLHNGSVPTLAALLDSSKRPKYWRRSFDSADYDQAAVGWNHEALETGHDEDPSARKRIYDTTRPGYSNEGHLFGDALSAEERAALIEYLKTL